MRSIVDNLGTTDALAEVFSDRSFIAAMLQFEAALARAEAQAGIIPASVADVIERAAQPDAFDAREIVKASRTSGTVAVPLVQQLTARVRSEQSDAAAFVHRGATSQDVTDTALVLCLARAAKILAADHQRLTAALQRLSDDHADTMMLARTLLQPAAPTTLGLKAAGWFAAVTRSGNTLFDAFAGARMLQLGGAAGTLAALGSDGPQIAAAVARQLELGDPHAPWHVHRDRLAWLVAGCAVYTGSVAKIARDISLLMQFEVGEAAEPGGSSSTMPHKRNPALCAIALAAATRVPGLVASYLAGMSQEHERGLGNWHAENATVSTVVQLTGSALAAMGDAVTNLRVEPATMRANIERTRGLIFAEAAMMLLAPAIGRAEAEDAIRAAIDGVGARGANFVDALLANDVVRTALSLEDRARLAAPDAYLGAAEQLRRGLLGRLTSGSSGD